MSKKLKDSLKMQDKNYLAKDFSSFKGDLTRYAQNYFVRQNSDFSDASLGGMFIELAAYVGDSMSFFLDHQFNELQPELAVEAKSVMTHAKNAGVKIVGASPAATELEFFIEVTSKFVNGEYIPEPRQLPIILEGTECRSTEGIAFSTAEDIDFGERNSDGSYIAKITTSAVDSTGNPSAFILSRKVTGVSGRVFIDTNTLGPPRPFLKIPLPEKDVSEIISVVDSEENKYYEVDFLSQNTAFKKTKNLSSDDIEVPSILQVVNAARRFTVTTDMNSRLTTLQFGGGDESLPDNDAIPDPSELALPLYGRTTFTRFAIDPKNLIRTQTLGIAPANTTLTITYRAGGGQNHNVSANSINVISKIRIVFPKNASAIESSTVVESMDVVNNAPASGGLRAPGISEVRAQIATSRNQQSRIVTQDDLLARVYTLPSRFGRVFRAAIRKSSRNPLASELYIISKNRAGQLIISPDSLKRNLSTYLNEFRLVSDAIDVLDATVINYGIEYSVVITPDANKASVLAACNSSIQSIATVDQYQIDQPLIEADFINAIINTNGVLSLQKIQFFNISGLSGGRDYSSYSFDLAANLFKGMIVGPSGTIFEMRFPGSDISGRAE